jgi:hypothetical protein
MDVSELPEDSFTITWNPHRLTLNDLAQLTSLLLDLHNEVAVPYVITQSDSNEDLPKSPLVTSIHMGSPLIAQLLAGPGEIAIASLGMVGYILRNPDKLGGFLPAVRASWHRANRIAEEEKIQRIEVRLKQIQGFPDSNDWPLLVGASQRVGGLSSICCLRSGRCSRRAAEMSTCELRRCNYLD